jgi:hypothetical protein
VVAAIESGTEPIIGASLARYGISISGGMPPLGHPDPLFAMGAIARSTSRERLSHAFPRRTGRVAVLCTWIQVLMRRG